MRWLEINRQRGGCHPPRVSGCLGDDFLNGPIINRLIRRHLIEYVRMQLQSGIGSNFCQMIIKSNFISKQSHYLLFELNIQSLENIELFYFQILHLKISLKLFEIAFHAINTVWFELFLLRPQEQSLLIVTNPYKLFEYLSIQHPFFIFKLDVVLINVNGNWFLFIIL